MLNRYPKNPLTRNGKSPHPKLYVNGIPFHLHNTVARKSAKVKTLLECNKIDEVRGIFKDMDIDSFTFELLARFCSGYKIQLTSENILSVISIAHYLDMNDDHSSNNLLNKAVIYLEQDILTSWNELVKALSVCSDKILHKLADLGLIEVFIDSLVDKALKEPRLLEDLITLPPLRLYKREVIEAVERLLPHVRGVVSCGFLFKALKEAISLDVSADCRKGFEVRISKQLDLATSKDLMILFSKDGAYDTELLRTIISTFCGNNVTDVSRLVNVARMLEEFLSEAAASDITVETFKELGGIAVAASCDVLSYSDGIYNAVDVFLEMRKELSESERMEVCRVLECGKLSPEACEHASGNEKLPLRVVVQVLFLSQKEIWGKVGVERKCVDDEMEDMSRKLLKLEIESGYGKKREFEKVECVAGCERNMMMNEKKNSVWREVKRKFGCMTVDACNCHIKKRKKFIITNKQNHLFN